MCHIALPMQFHLKTQRNGNWYLYPNAMCSKAGTLKSRRKIGAFLWNVAAPNELPIVQTLVESCKLNQPAENGVDLRQIGLETNPMTQKNARITGPGENDHPRIRPTRKQITNIIPHEIH